MSTDPVFMKQGSEYYWYHNDHLGTPQVMTTSSGTVVWSAKYTSFGKASVDPSSTVVNPLRFPGQYEDVENGLLYNRYRYYVTLTGRYSREDTIGFIGGTNLFLYVHNDPVNWIDPFGLHDMKTSKGNTIKHRHRHEVPFPEPTKIQEDIYTEKQKKRGATKTGKGGFYENCHGDAYRPADNVWISDPTVIIVDEYNEIPASKAKVGDKVTYYDSGGNPVHSGTVSGSDSIDSKHGGFPKYDGPTKATDKAYPSGVTKKYYRKR